MDFLYVLILVLLFFCTVARLRSYLDLVIYKNTRQIQAKDPGQLGFRRVKLSHMLQNRVF